MVNSYFDSLDAIMLKRSIILKFVIWNRSLLKTTKKNSRYTSTSWLARTPSKTKQVGWQWTPMYVEGGPLKSIKWPFQLFSCFTIRVSCHGELKFMGSYEVKNSSCNVQCRCVLPYSLCSLFTVFSVFVHETVKKELLTMLPRGGQDTLGEIYNFSGIMVTDHFGQVGL